jgi:hypothetical protein
MLHNLPWSSMSAPPLPQLEPTEVRTFVAIQTLGLCTAVEAGVLNGEHLHRWLFRPAMSERLDKAGACRGCLDLVALGTRLADNPDTLSDTIGELRAHALAVLGVCIAGDSAAG